MAMSRLRSFPSRSVDSVRRRNSDAAASSFLTPSGSSRRRAGSCGASRSAIDRLWAANRSSWVSPSLGAPVSSDSPASSLPSDRSTLVWYMSSMTSERSTSSRNPMMRASSSGSRVNA